MHIINLSILAGIIGTGIGGFITAIFGTRSDKMISFFLSFAGGIMLSIVFFELIPESVLLANTAIAISGLIAGIILTIFLDYLVDKISHARHIKSKLSANYKEFFHETEMISQKKNMLQAGVLMLLAIALHNIPEGLAVGAAGSHEFRLGATLALLIGLHNIPEGMALSAPLIAGGLDRNKTVLLALLAGMPTVLGALIGYLVGGISATAIALSYSIAGGAMLYLVFCEILPQTAVTNKDRLPPMVLLLSVILGFILTKI